jgi:hypothetical protein
MKISLAVPERLHAKRCKGGHDKAEADFQIICWPRAKNYMSVAE